ncbi:ornithine aminomutase [Desulforhabdus amnigena]|jgi:D-ornithine 4,5-aminomutase subunit alpha|uniref:Ornithine aminomutase n=1 Tax=Desulforhabdus amnigena TaxID=40218 RepID=A0A9W6FU04_9BACT|nr:ornithine aminomutase subunit alpha [Desulforhabdus amnigena]GLI34849.1 ornithine aminomutase [Desulforhabdus amnigena]
MSITERADDFKTRRQHLEKMSDEELHTYFWTLVNQIVQPLVEEAKTHTSPSIERSVLLRMGFSSLEAKSIVNTMLEKGILGHGAGNLILRLARKKGIAVREAGLALMDGKYWEEVAG